MESFDAGSLERGLARVITLEKAEQFALSAPGADDSWRVSSVTAFGGGSGSGAAYFTVAGVRLADGSWSELDHEFRDAGVLPPHVRELVEPLVPVMDGPSQTRGFATHRKVDPERVESPYAVEPQTVLTQMQRRAQFEAAEQERWAARSRHPSVAMDARVVQFPKSPVNPYRGRV